MYALLDNQSCCYQLTKNRGEDRICFKISDVNHKVTYETKCIMKL